MKGDDTTFIELPGKLLKRCISKNTIQFGREPRLDLGEREPAMSLYKFDYVVCYKYVLRHRIGCLLHLCHSMKANKSIPKHVTKLTEALVSIAVLTSTPPPASCHSVPMDKRIHGCLTWKSISSQGQYVIQETSLPKTTTRSGKRGKESLMTVNHDSQP